MKNVVRKVPAALSLVLLAAHFLRAQSLFFVLLSIGLTPLLFWEKRWLTQLVRIYLALGSLLWVYTAVMIVRERKALELPFAAAAIILGSVTIFTLMSALLAAPAKHRAA
jgi:hypothetical protein